ncbi:PLP-dependent transferase [Pseudovirgaria hyperparasitica]|uniref:PLP-dependent transferase n=1 Tax=Pseudovirgaria hyperparasitica TaxID=470096 RepID=A0A6A6VYK1_9PEZI|nr:PLP-dependent transferase [Pseudovirgaria hyperparasitica]KAF2755295.1 PLP-dependent transferase [Pseudovirgaria hyperparasitica]
MDISRLSAGDALPHGDIYGVSVHLPRWADTVAWAERDPKLLLKLKTGYPRFFIPRVVLQLGSRILEEAASSSIQIHSGSAWSDAQTVVSGDSLAVSSSVLLLSSLTAARMCHQFLSRNDSQYGPILRIRFPGVIHIVGDADVETDHIVPTSDIYAVTYAEGSIDEAKAFWQHTGFGITSRCAVYWLQHAFQLQPELPCRELPSKLPLKEAGCAYTALQSRIASQMSTKQVEVLSRDVILFPTGMSAITNIALGVRSMQEKKLRVGHVAVFGFLYVDTFKTLSRIHDFKCTLYGHASSSDLDKLIADLNRGLTIDALYTEFPGNPLLVAPDLKELHRLSLEHDFVLIVDDTVVTAINASLFPYCDIICTSLTKMFSGACNVMGGSVTLNPQSRWYTALHGHLIKQPKEPYFPLDILVMEQNSRDFSSRVECANQNAEIIVQQLKQHDSVSEVFYPKESVSKALYDELRRPDGRYGFLLSILFVSPAAAIAFHDALDVAKGPSLGTNFTLACPYTLLAHYRELEWAAKFGVVEHLVRISVGVESTAYLEEVVAKALEAAASV